MYSMTFIKQASYFVLLFLTLSLELLGQDSKYLELRMVNEAFATKPVDDSFWGKVIKDDKSISFLVSVYKANPGYPCESADLGGEDYSAKTLTNPSIIYSFHKEGRNIKQVSKGNALLLKRQKSSAFANYVVKATFIETSNESVAPLSDLIVGLGELIPSTTSYSAIAGTALNLMKPFIEANGGKVLHKCIELGEKIESTTWLMSGENQITQINPNKAPKLKDENFGYFTIQPKLKEYILQTNARWHELSELFPQSLWKTWDSKVIEIKNLYAKKFKEEGERKAIQLCAEVRESSKDYLYRNESILLSAKVLEETQSPYWTSNRYHECFTPSDLEQVNTWAAKINQPPIHISGCKTAKCDTTKKIAQDWYLGFASGIKLVKDVSGDVANANMKGYKSFYTDAQAGLSFLACLDNAQVYRASLNRDNTKMSLFNVANLDQNQLPFGETQQSIKSWCDSKQTLG